VWNELEREAVSILKRLEAHGFEAFLVGGYVRDKVLGKDVKDIDIATSAKPEQVMALFKRTVPTGLKHGTVTVISGGKSFEVTTYRKESEYEDFRRPAEVEFITDLEEDLRRRDFTMNAMAMDADGQIRDPFGGREDLASRVLRAVGDPEERFQEDALRMLRCVRFASTYHLDVEPGTWEALLKHRALLQHVAMERVRMELERMMEGPRPFAGWQLLMQSGLAAYTKEAFLSPYDRLDPDHLPKVLQVLDQLPEARLRWMLIAIASGCSPDEVRAAFRRLTFPVKEMQAIAKAVSVHRWVMQTAWNESDAAKQWKTGAVDLGVEPVRHWLMVARTVCDAGSRFEDGDVPGFVWRNGEGWLAEMPVAEPKQLAVDGREMMRELGAPSGPWLGRLLKELTLLVATGMLPNERNALIGKACEWYAAERSKSDE